MTRYFKATFSNGKIKKRSSASRAYTHAYHYISFGGYEAFGFSSSEGQCHSNLENESAWGRRNSGPLQFAEVVPVEEMTAKEYRSK
jgi:hypothetical protein